jgi:hypothetical protein
MPKARADAIIAICRKTALQDHRLQKQVFLDAGF